MEEAVAEPPPLPLAQGLGGGAVFRRLPALLLRFFFFTQDKGGPGLLGLLP